LDFRESQELGWSDELKPAKSSGSIFGLAKELAEILLIAGALFLLVNLVSARVRVESISMEPNLHEGDFVVVNRMAYRWREPERGDVIVFRFPGDSKKRYIKRVIGVGGDRLIIDDGMVYVNDLLIDEPYIAASPVYAGEWTVGPEEVFVLGDNRNNSNDSKNWGMLNMDSIVGEAVLIYWPPSDIGLLPTYDVIGVGVD
jgi:signal peptidase I